MTCLGIARQQALYFSFLLVNQAAQLKQLPLSTPASPAVALKDKPAAIRLINWELRSFTCSCAKRGVRGMKRVIKGNA